jgi:hypothetical protein
LKYYDDLKERLVPFLPRLQSETDTLDYSQDPACRGYRAIRKHQKDRQVTRFRSTEAVLHSLNQTAEMLDGQCGKGNGKLWIEAMGSYRRGEADSGDLDVLISRDTSDGKGGSSKFSSSGTVYEPH